MRYMVAILFVLIAVSAAGQAEAHYTAEDIQAAMSAGADGDADRFRDDCEAGTGRGGLFGRVAGAFARDQIRARVGGRLSRTAAGAAARVGLRDQLTAAQESQIGEIADAVAQRAANGALPPLPNDIPVLGETPMSRLADLAEGLRRTYRPLPEVDAAEVVEIVGDDLFDVHAEAYVDGIEYIVLRPRGDDDDQSIVHPVSLENRGVSLTAQFPGDAVRRIVANTDVAVVLITPEGEFRCNLDDRRIRRGLDPLQ